MRPHSPASHIWHWLFIIWFMASRGRRYSPYRITVFQIFKNMYIFLVASKILVFHLAFSKVVRISCFSAYKFLCSIWFPTHTVLPALLLTFCLLVTGGLLHLIAGNPPWSFLDFLFLQVLRFKHMHLKIQRYNPHRKDCKQNVICHRFPLFLYLS